MWSQLETLAITYFAGLSMKEMEDILPRLRKLKEVVLPQSIPSCDVHLYESLSYELVNQTPPVGIRLEDFEPGGHRDDGCLLFFSDNHVSDDDVSDEDVSDGDVSFDDVSDENVSDDDMSE